MQPLLTRWRRWRNVQCQLALLGLFTLLCLGSLHVQRLDFKQSSQRTIIHVPLDQLREPAQNQLINLEDFGFLINNANVCSGSPVYVLAFVHSAPADSHARNAIRATWGGVRNVSHLVVRTVFLLGYTDPELQERIERENDVHRDIVQGNFVDSYANLSYKHIMGHKWVAAHCNHTTFVLKTDEDVYVDMFQFVDYLVTLYGPSPPRTLICNVHPEGTPTLRKGKWTVPVSTYPYSVYPRYCAGLAYVVTPDVSRDFSAVSSYVPFFWIDDVYVTGFLAEALRLRHLSLNFRMTLNVDSIIKWLQSNTTFPAPYLIVGIGDVSAWTRFLRMLWDKTLSIIAN